jgi:flagellin
VRIHTNALALSSYRYLSNSRLAVAKSFEKLSSGIRINRAADDAAGLAISQKMRSQIRGLEQSSRNIQDAISLIQVADGGMNEIHSLLQRGRELSVQASNHTLTVTDKQNIQEEITQLLEEIDKISQETTFNNKNLLNVVFTSNPTPPSGSGTSPMTDEEKIMESLKRSMLQQSEQMIKTYYGLEADGVDMEIIIKDYNDPNALAWVQYNVDVVTGKGYNIEMHLDKQDFLPPDWPNGGTAPIYNDRIIAHELTHAVMARTMNFYSLPKWFKEGAAEFIHGADERLNADIFWNGKSAVVNAIGDGTDSTWVSGSISYSSGYVAVRYLHDRIKQAGGQGIKDVMVYLKNNPTADLDEALKNIPYGAYAGGLSAFISDYKTNGVNFIDAKMDLTNTDTGAIGGLDADGGVVKTAESVVADIDNYTDNPLNGFKEIWLDSSGNVIEVSSAMEPAEILNNVNGTGTVTIQIGPNSSDSFSFQLVNVSVANLGIETIDVVNNAIDAIGKLDRAIQYVSSERGRLGAIQNRLERALNVVQIMNENTTASLSRIEDVDMAKEIMQLTVKQMLSQVSQSILSQSNQLPQSVLQLLR